MKFDSNQAWKDASASVSANRDVLLALAGVFVALPTFAMAIFVPPPTTPAGSDAEASLAVMGEYYSHAWPLLIGVALLSLLGTLTMLTLFTDRSRPTVGEAIRQGARAVLPVIAAQILFGVVIGLAASILLGGAMASGSTALKLLVSAGLALGVGYAAVRVSLVSPVVVVDGQRSPVAALRRSWALTGANVLRLFLFYALLLIAFLVNYVLISSGFGLLIALVASGTVAAGINNLIAAFLQAILSVYSVAVVAAVHRQLAGPSAEAMARPFE